MMNFGHKNFYNNILHETGSASKIVLENQCFPRDEKLKNSGFFFISLEKSTPNKEI